MDKIVKLLILSIVGSVSCFAQEKDEAPFDFAPIGSKWYISKPEGTSPPNEGFVLYEAIKDTIVLGTNTRLISRTYFNSNGKDFFKLPNEYVYYQDSIVNYLRNGKFYILYNFKAKKGESWTVHGSDMFYNFCGKDSTGLVVVDSVAFTICNGITLKMIYTSFGLNSQWGYKAPIVERIGCLDHLFPRSKECAVDLPNPESQLRCYEDEKIKLYKSKLYSSSNFECNRLVNYVESTKISESKLKFYPNPVTNYLYIEGLPVQTSRVVISNVLGLKIPVVIDNNRIDLSELPQGIYILSFFSSVNKIYEFKILKNTYQ